jgi:hypothetical protein
MGFHHEDTKYAKPDPLVDFFSDLVRFVSLWLSFGAVYDFCVSGSRRFAGLVSASSRLPRAESEMRRSSQRSRVASCFGLVTLWMAVRW